MYSQVPVSVSLMQLYVSKYAQILKGDLCALAWRVISYLMGTSVKVKILRRE